MSGWVAGAIVTGAVVGGVASSSAAKTQARATEAATAAQTASTEKAIDAQALAAEKGIEAQERMFERQVALQEPWRVAGVNALNKLIPMSMEYQPFTAREFQADPGYAFRLNEGIKALDRSAAARGGLLSGNQLRGVTEYGQNLASQEFTNAFNRYQAERAARMQPLQSLAGVGQSASNTLAGAAGQLGTGMASAYGQLGAGTASAYSQLGQNVGANLIGAGNARASGYMGMANALTGGVGQYLNFAQNQALMNRMFPTYGGSVGGAIPVGVPLPGNIA
jgi:hypothetical protein